MKKQDFSTTFTVDRSPEDVYAAINDVRSWWTGEIDGRADALGASFTYRHEQIHRSTHEVVDLVPGKRVAWRVTSSHLSSFDDPREWDGTEIVFDIARKGDATEVRFTHVGLTPALACYEDCTAGWRYFAIESLQKRLSDIKPR